MQIAYHEGEKGIDGTVEISAGFEVRIYIKVKNAEGGREVEKEEVIHFGDSRFEYSVRSHTQLSLFLTNSTRYIFSSM